LASPSRTASFRNSKAVRAVCVERPIDFEAMDSQPVDLVFLLLAPKARAPIT
jgi:mannitol/fructose-specific phosphotransferase system IIA component (Ntr-type)